MATLRCNDWASLASQYRLIQPVIHTLHLPIDFHKHREAIIVHGAMFWYGRVDLPELYQLRHILQRDLAQPRRGNEGRAARISLYRVFHLAHFDLQHIGQDLTPDIRVATAAHQIDLLHRAAHELFDGWHQPARVEGHAFQKGANDVFTIVIQ